MLGASVTETMLPLLGFEPGPAGADLENFQREGVTTSAHKREGGEK